MTTRYNIEVTMIDVHEWDEEGQGKYVCSKGGYTIGTEPTLEKARQHINEYFGYEIDDDCIDGDRIMANQIENADGYQDDNGTYIADYDIRIDRVETITFNEGY
tara:strand:+ start:1023 stop:1334 length:312 start_codon:yes stop_codon:yes gene_type:complete